MFGMETSPGFGLTPSGSQLPFAAIASPISCLTEVCSFIPENNHTLDPRSRLNSQQTPFAPFIQSSQTLFALYSAQELQ